MFVDKPTKAEVVQALEALVDIPRPNGDNENAAINSEIILVRLSESHREKVESAESLVMAYTRRSSDSPYSAEEVDKRSITELNKAGYEAHLNQDQCDPYRLCGTIQVGDWSLDISDPKSENDA